MFPRKPDSHTHINPNTHNNRYGNYDRNYTRINNRNRNYNIWNRWNLSSWIPQGGSPAGYHKEGYLCQGYAINNRDNYRKYTINNDRNYTRINNRDNNRNRNYNIWNWKYAIIDIGKM